MKYSLSSFYQEYIKERILKNFLKSGKIPTKNQLDSALSESLKDTDNFSKPLISTVNYWVESEEVSSASKMNKAYTSIELDLDICVNALLDQENKITNLYDSTFSKLSGLQKKISTINKEVDKLLFESKNTDNHEELFYEKFSSNEMIDLTNSTIDLDTKSGDISIKASEQMPILITNGAQNISVVVEKNPKVITSTDVGEMRVGNIVNSSNKVWLHQVSASEPLASLSLDLIIRIPSIDQEVNKIVFDSYSVDLKTQVNVELAYSSDGLNWTYPDGEYKKRMDQTTSLNFKGVQKEYWRIRFTKFGNDGFFSNYYVYNFGLKSLNFFGKTYDKVSRLDLGYFYSKPIVFKNNIKMANFKICENKPQDTSIKYGVAPIFASDLLSIQNGTKSILDLSYISIDFTDKSSATIDFLNTVNAPIMDNLALSTTLSYKDQKDFDYCLNTALPSNYSKSQTILLRDGLKQSEHGALGKEKNIDGEVHGWKFDGSFYSTYLLVEDFEGVEIDLGSTFMFINNVKVSGKVLLKQGINFIVTSKDNWHSLDLTTLPVEADQIVDYLYPYNHKYLIEGIGFTIYGRDVLTPIDGKTLLDIIDKNNIYSKTVRKCWAIKMTEVPFNDFVAKNKNELDVFSYKIDNTNQERIVAKFSKDIGLINDETFSIITKLHSAENIKGLIFKAILETDDVKVSPVLTEYLVKIK